MNDGHGAQAYVASPAAASHGRGARRLRGLMMNRVTESVASSAPRGISGNVSGSLDAGVANE
jgi:hypothetical protein